MNRFYALTLFPDFFQSFKDTGIVRKGLEKGLYEIIIKNIRDNAVNNYGQVDDVPYGGGHGMLLRPEPIFESFDDLNIPKENRKVIYFSPKGKLIDRDYIINLTNYENIVIICGHYEGVDQRIIDSLVDDEISLGDYILTGGEIPAMALIDATVRNISGTIRKESLEDESFSNGILEYRQWTRPAVYRDMRVPEILVSGHHENIRKYKIEDSVRETLKYRKDLVEKNNFDYEIENIIKKIKREQEDEFT